MTRQPVTSSQLRAVGYDPAEKILEIEFHNGSIYQYSDVPEAMYRDLIEAESIGKYFNKHIKFGRPYEKIGKAEKEGEK